MNLESIRKSKQLLERISQAQQAQQTILLDVLQLLTEYADFLKEEVAVLEKDTQGAKSDRS